MSFAASCHFDHVRDVSPAWFSCAVFWQPVAHMLKEWGARIYPIVYGYHDNKVEEAKPLDWRACLVYVGCSTYAHAMREPSITNALAWWPQTAGP